MSVPELSLLSKRRLFPSVLVNHSDIFITSASVIVSITIIQSETFVVSGLSTTVTYLLYYLVVSGSIALTQAKTFVISVSQQQWHPFHCSVSVSLAVHYLDPTRSSQREREKKNDNFDCFPHFECGLTERLFILLFITWSQTTLVHMLVIYPAEVELSGKGPNNSITVKTFTLRDPSTLPVEN